MKTNIICLFFVCIITSLNITAQDKKVSVANTLDEQTISGLTFRNIGPALMSGRISDIAIHLNNPSTWYITVGSGGVWKTENAGNTWKPIFDDKPSFSIGCVTIDQSKPSTVWIGTGENVGGRHVGYSDGIYRSDDDGKTFTNLGLKQSEHISKIIVHPSNSNIVWVAAQGPLWSKGGERGVFKTIDGGKTWKQTLGDKEWMGATDMQIDPRNPNVLYAAAWQRHRTIAAYMGGGPLTAIYKSYDGGDSWTKLTAGLPSGNMGKIGLAISPQKPDVVYAAIELERRSGGVYRSADGGANWTKMSDAVSGATGPHYYQELYASPHQFDKLYLMDVRVQISNDGGKTFQQMKEENKHSDNHAIAFIKDRPDYLLVGTDGGMYESHDNAENWKFFANLPLTQFYDVAIDDSKPFYKLYGGTQDNSTQGGPSRTDKVQGIQNSDWSVVLDWDGQQPATEPGNPNIIYGQRQEGTLSRIDMKTGEVVDIKPNPDKNESYERWNWDAPILVSPHDPKQLFFASQRVWRSNDRGDSWTPISGDLTKNQRRVDLPIMGSTQGYDNSWDLLAMSNFNTITMVAESPKQRDLIYAGTDDGLIQITEDGGKNWRKIDVSALPGCPATAYVNEIKADLFDASTVYVAGDNIKYGDYNPYIYKSTDKGKTWKSIKSNLPERQSVWRLVQDHINPSLMFIGTEFGLFVTINGGESWSKMKGGLPTIPVRDLAIHKGENDLVLATFGRGFYILDDISPLRNMADDVTKLEATLFAVKDAHWYIPRSHLGFDGPKGDQGAGHYTAPNPAFGAAITYYLKDEFKSLKDLRKEKEKKALEAKQAIAFPSWDELAKEENETPAKIIITITDDAGQVIRKMNAPAQKGLNRVNWDLKYSSTDAIAQGSNPQPGFMVAPGKYFVSISKEVNGIVTSLSEKKSFNVTPLYQGTLSQMSTKDVAAFWRKFEKLNAAGNLTSLKVNNTAEYAKLLKTAIANTNLTGVEEANTLFSVNTEVIKLNEKLNGQAAKSRMGEKNNPTINDRFFEIYRAVGGATYGPTKTALKNMDIIDKEISEISTTLTPLIEKLKSV